MRHVTILAASAALLASTGCNLIPGMAALGPKVRVTGKVYAQADQVAMVAAGAGNLVAAGGLNYTLMVHPGEKGLPGAKISIAGGVTLSDTTGSYVLEVPGGAIHKADINVTTSKGGTMNLVGVAIVGTGATTCDFDAANVMVASKVYSNPKFLITPPDATKLQDAINKTRAALSSVSKLPQYIDQSGAAAAFDANVKGDAKTAVDAL